MSSLYRSASLVLTVAACALVSVAAEPAARPTKEQVAQWVRQLGDDDFSTREEASKKLYQAGQAAESSLEEATHSDDAEVARRAAEIMEKFKWGLYPDAPQKVVELISRYRAADPNGKQAVIRELLDAGPSGYRTLLKLAGAEEDAAVRSSVFAVVSGELSHAAPQMMLDENYDTLELLLEVVLANDPEQGAAHYAAYWMMRGKLDDRIVLLKTAAAKAADGKKIWETVSCLYHAKGDLAAAREAAEKAEKPELVDALLFEAGDWKELAKRPTHADSNFAYEAPGFEAAYRRLAGDAKGSDDALADLRKLAAAAPGDEFERFHLAKVLFLNDRPGEAIEVLTDTPGPHAQEAAYEALAAQLRYADALKLADAAVKAKAPEAAVLEILKARTLYSLGDKETASAIFARYGDQITEGADSSWFETLIDAENKVGLKDQAAAHAAKVLSTSGDKGWSDRLFPKLFPKNGEAAAALWVILREKQGDQTPDAAMKRLRGLLDGTADPKAVVDLADQIERDGTNLFPGPADRRRALAEAALATKQEALARSLLKKARSAAALVRLGDLDADKKEWAKAAESYADAWEKDQGRALALYLNGWALTQAGQDKEGKRRMELAHWIPLGDGEARLAFLRSLAERGRREAERREGELLLRLSAAGSYYAAEGMRQVALEALDRKDYLAAAAGQERSMLRCLSTAVNYVQPAAYLGVPAFVHRLRAEGCTAAGKIDDARREAALCLTELPGDTYIPIELVPAWDKAGRKKEAAELFEQCMAVQEKLCQEYPKCSWAHNSAAWIAACCRRNLEAAQEHALKSVALTPNSPGNLDTLAEVYFQRGDREKAIAAQKKASELDPKRPYYRKQLKRIEAGDPAADRPAEDDDDE